MLRSHVASWRARRLRRAARQVLVSELGLELEDAPPLVDSPRRTVLSVVDGAGRRYVAKAAYGSHLSRHARLERWVAAAGIPVPALVHFVDGAPQVMVTERIVGPSLPERSDAAAWRAAGRVLRSLHLLAVPEMLSLPQGPSHHWEGDIRFETHRAVTERRIGVALGQDVVACAAELAHLVTAQDSRAVVHGDCMPKHFIFDGDQALLIDLEWLRIDDGAWDLATLCAFDPHRREDVLSGYAPGTEEEERLRRVVPVRQMERLLRAINWTSTNNYPVDPCVTALAACVAELRAAEGISR